MRQICSVNYDVIVGKNDLWGVLLFMDYSQVVQILDRGFFCSSPKE